MSNLLKDASILLTPTGYDNGSMNAIKPEDGDGDFTFVRNSAATRVNAQGLVENVQIISSELVTNGDFSQIGTEEVTNGNFSQIGSEEVLNGNFSQEGSEEVLNGDFEGVANGTDVVTLSGWSAYGSVTSRTIEDGVLVLVTSAGNTGVYLSLSLTVGKTYRLTATTSGDTGLLGVHVGGIGDFSTIGGVDATFTAVASDTLVYFRAGNNTSGTINIDNVSAKEVGQNWSLGTGWSIGDDKAISSGTDSAVSGWLRQNNIIIAGKSYKLTFDVATTDTGTVLDVNDSFVNLANIEGSGSKTVYFKSQGVEIAFSQRIGKTASVTNISVKEVGQDWILGSGWSIGDNKAICDGSQTGNTGLQQSGIAVSGKIYKIQFDLTVDAGFINFVNFGGWIDNTNLTTSNTYTYYTTTTINTDNLGISGDSNFVGSVDNVSVKEVGQGWTLGNGWSVDQANSKATHDGSVTLSLIHI